MSEILITFNPGSSTIKLGLYRMAEDGPVRLGRGVIDLRRTPLLLHVVEGPTVADIPLRAEVTEDLHELIDETLGWLSDHFALQGIAAAGHRVVHGGDAFSGATLITDDTLATIARFVDLAPLHQPQSLRLIRAIRHLRPDLPQTASFDTAFHRTQSDIVRRFALPREMFDAGIKRYGFHGLSYKFVASRLRELAPDLAAGRVVAAHLGSGASLCALENGESRDTSMGFSTLDGIPMATRCGALDPGVVIHLLKQQGQSLASVEDILYHRSGLLGVSGISADSRDLLGSDQPAAREAIELFTHRIAQEIAALATTLGGLDAVIFTAGIGEHQPAIRAEVCARLAWLGITLDDNANAANATRIDAQDSEVGVLVIPTDEEQVIAIEACALLKSSREA
ncbi:Acetate kinase [Hyphomicrobium sp. GJ21]|uniref:acetate/propionate family kinase n=1 Tax=Hyphomicrobium sp. GJ21 TaxID=113574 RepID=UPI000622BD07|nr:acetate/propionate family kinase [Hyphomicrobium sp. GJ21]CEJ84317.1 Acetate kinase [Hyphomicrobium sp. GJ21]